MPSRGNRKPDAAVVEGLGVAKVTTIYVYITIVRRNLDVQDGLRCVMAIMVHVPYWRCIRMVDPLFYHQRAIRIMHVQMMPVGMRRIAVRSADAYPDVHPGVA
jgi:hypothetical protein